MLTMAPTAPIVLDWEQSYAYGQNGFGTVNGHSSHDEVLREVEESGMERSSSHIVSFHYNSGVEQHHFGRSHPMKPWRLVLTKQLILAYGLQYAMDLYQTREATKQELTDFHSQEYLEFLQTSVPILPYTPPPQGNTAC